METDQELETRIREAMDRLIEGRPINTESENLSIANLAKEAQVGRYILTEKRTDLRDEFNKRVARIGWIAPEHQKALDKLAELEAQTARLRESRDYWKNISVLMARRMQVDLLDPESGRKAS